MADYKPLRSSAPAHSILNAEAFQYTNAASTDLRKTFAAARRRMARAAEASNANSVVTPLRKKI